MQITTDYNRVRVWITDHNNAADDVTRCTEAMTHDLKTHHATHEAIERYMAWEETLEAAITALKRQRYTLYAVANPLMTTHIPEYEYAFIPHYTFGRKVATDVVEIWARLKR